MDQFYLFSWQLAIAKGHTALELWIFSKGDSRGEMATSTWLLPALIARNNSEKQMIKKIIQLGYLSGCKIAACQVPVV